MTFPYKGQLSILPMNSFTRVCFVPHHLVATELHFQLALAEEVILESILTCSSLSPFLSLVAENDMPKMNGHFGGGWVQNIE